MSGAVGGHVLVADDDQTVRTLIALKLSRAGATVHEAADGAEALEACRRGGIDLVLLDIEMPRLNGFEVLEALRSDPGTADLPVLLLTAHSAQGGVAKGLGLGAHDYIRKPFDLDELQARVDSAILLSRRSRELADSEAAFRGLFEGANTAMSIVGMDGALRRVNQAWAELLGRPADSIGSLDTYLLVHPDDRAAYSEVIGEMRTSGVDQVRGRLRFLRPDGEIRWTDVSTTLVRDGAGAPAYLYRVMVDITSLEQAHDATRSAEKRFRDAFERAPVGMAEISPDGGLNQVNDALADLLGYPPEQLLGRTDIALTQAEDAPSTAEAISRMASGEWASYRAEKRYVHADGHLIWVALSVVAVSDNSGKVAHLLAHYLDITERKRSDARLEKLVDHDPLTGLLNRRGFEAALDRQTAAVHRYGPGGAILMLDLDNLKWANDTLGHSMGDQLIVSMAELLGNTLRETDTVARLGGDEFAVILPRATRAEAEAAASRIVRSARDRVGAAAGVSGCSPTVSVGVAMFDDASLSGRTVLGRADLTMYEAKKSGGDRYTFASSA